MGSPVFDERELFAARPIRIEQVRPRRLGVRYGAISAVIGLVGAPPAAVAGLGGLLLLILCSWLLERSSGSYWAQRRLINLMGVSWMMGFGLLAVQGRLFTAPSLAVVLAAAWLLLWVGVTVRILWGALPLLREGAGLALQGGRRLMETLSQLPGRLLDRTLLGNLHIEL